MQKYTYYSGTNKPSDIIIREEQVAISEFSSYDLICRITATLLMVPISCTNRESFKGKCCR